MENELLALKRNACMLGLCGQYKTMWDECRNKKDLIGMALDANGVEFMADSIEFGWGLSKEYLIKEFGDFVNGKYQRNKGGYKSRMYVGYEGDITIDSTITLLVGCKGRVIVPCSMVGNIYICGGCDIDVTNDGVVYLYTYGSSNKVHEDENVEVIQRKESQWVSGRI